MSQRAAIRRRRQAVMGDRQVAPGQRKYAKPTPAWQARKPKK